jgi:hypothetical protein
VRLRHTFTPYAGLCVIMGSISVLGIFTAFKVSDWSLLWIPFGCWGTLGVYVAFATRYRISWNESGVTMHADWGKRIVRFEEISSVCYETASLADGAYLSRPFRRIVIHGNRDNPKAFVDVSLRHFMPSDIEVLLTEISRRRPDLSIPWQPVRKYLSLGSAAGLRKKRTSRRGRVARASVTRPNPDGDVRPPQL